MSRSEGEHVSPLVSPAGEDHPLQRPVALVTGPTAGIGYEFACRLAKRGYDLVLVARDEQRLVAVAAELEGYGARSEVIVADLSDRSQVEPVEKRLAMTDRPVDLLVNNAGYGHRYDFLDTSVDDEVAMLDVLVTAVLRLSHAALSTMVARRRGGIINVSSLAGYVPRGSYSAAKAYVTSFSVWADLTFRGRGVRTMALLPGFTKTEFHARMSVTRPWVPAWMWLDAGRLVTAALDDFENGKTISIPSKRYKLVSLLARSTPSSLTGRI